VKEIVLAIFCIHPETMRLNYPSIGIILGTVY